MYNCTKKKKYIGINLTKVVKDLYSKSYKTLMNKTEDDTNKWKDIPCSHLEETILLKCLYYPKQSTDLSNPCERNKCIFQRTRTNDPKMCMKLQKILKKQDSLEKEEQSGRYLNSRFQDILYTKPG